jgi:hypothetical protein
MRNDYLDAIRYGLANADLHKTRCMGQWKIEEENNMDIPGKLREDLKRIYGNIDPLNCIEDIEVSESYDNTLVRLTLRVPMSCEKFARSSTSCGAPYSLEHWARQQAEMMCRCGIDLGVSPGAQKAPEKKVEVPENKNTVDFTKPERVLFSGPYTHLFWPDGSMTSVKLGEGEEYDEYTAFCAAVVKKMFGATHKAKKFLEKVKVIQKKKEKKKQNEPAEAVYQINCDTTTNTAKTAPLHSEEMCVPMEESV